MKEQILFIDVVEKKVKEIDASTSEADIEALLGYTSIGEDVLDDNDSNTDYLLYDGMGALKPKRIVNGGFSILHLGLDLIQNNAIIYRKGNGNKKHAPKLKPEQVTFVQRDQLPNSDNIIYYSDFS